MYFERTLITRVTTSLGKASKLEIGVDTKSHKKVAFHQLYSALGRPRRILRGATNKSLLPQLNSYYTCLYH